jgi:hypothetical protein
MTHDERIKKQIDEMMERNREIAMRNLEVELSRIRSLEPAEQRRYRRKLLHITKEALLRIMTPPPRDVSYIYEGLPEDAELVEVAYDAECARFTLLVVSDTFGVVPEGYMPPTLSIIIHRRDDTDAK